MKESLTPYLAVPEKPSTPQEDLPEQQESFDTKISERMLKAAEVIGDWQELGECVPSLDDSNQVAKLRANLASWLEQHPDSRLSDVIEFQISELEGHPEVQEERELNEARARLYGKEIKKHRERIDRIMNRVMVGITSLFPLYGVYFTGVNIMQKADGKFVERDRARSEMLKEGITEEQRSTYKFGLSELLEKGVIPQSYKTGERLITLMPNLLLDMESVLDRFTPSRQDAWRLYLGLPQKNNTFGVSNYKPERAMDDKYYYKINDFASYLESLDLKDIEKGSLSFSGLQELVQMVKEAGGVYIGSHPEIMGSYKLSLGEDERGTYISYYDKWDLNIATEKRGGFIGRPFEIYDRIYYDPETYEIVYSEVDGNSLAMAE